MIFKHSGNENDAHIFYSIEKSTITNLYVGYYNDEDRQRLSIILGNSGLYLKENLIITYFPTNDVNVWSEDFWTENTATQETAQARSTG